MCHDLNLQFHSPFVNLWLKPGDFIRYLKDIDYYRGCKLSFISEEGITYPVGILGEAEREVKIYFQHYKSEAEAEEKWIERTKRMNLDNCFILFTDRNGCSYEDLLEFDSLPYRNKIVFTNRKYPKIKSAYYIKGFEKENSVGSLPSFMNSFPGKRYYDQFDYVRWFNKGAFKNR